MRIFGLDPGIADTGYAVLDVDGDKYTLVTTGVIRTSKEFDFADRLLEINADLADLFTKYGLIDCVSIEKLFFGKNVQTAMNVAHARGVILMTVAERIKKPSIHEYAPSTIKKVVTGNGKADKVIIRIAIKRKLGIDIKEDNAADACAIALCHALMGQ